MSLLNNATLENNFSKSDKKTKTQLDNYYKFKQILPIPRWSKERSKSYKIKKQEDFNYLLEYLHQELGNSLQDLRYDTVENVLQFYRYYKKENGGFLNKFKTYKPKLPPSSHDCVGLVLELKRQFKDLENTFPDISNHFTIVSCQENLDKIREYTEFLTKVFEFKDLKEDSQKLLDFDKEHVVLCLKFELEFSKRRGTIIFDPGFHVGKAVVVMEDGFYPHTGWFIQKEDTNFKKLYEYSYSEGTKDFIKWNEKTTRDGSSVHVINVIYTGRFFLSYLDVTEKRNIAYFFKSLLSRDREGHVLAGIYFKIDLERFFFTVLYQKNGKQRIKMNFEQLTNNNEKLDKQVFSHLEQCSFQLGMSVDELVNILLKVKEMVNDKPFVKGLLEVEDYITDEISGLWSLEDPDHVYKP